MILPCFGLFTGRNENTVFLKVYTGINTRNQHFLAPPTYSRLTRPGTYQNVTELHPESTVSHSRMLQNPDTFLRSRSPAP